MGTADPALVAEIHRRLTLIGTGPDGKQYIVFTMEEAEALALLIIPVCAWKGGVGKSTLAFELAWVLCAVLLDLDWDKGGVTKPWGYNADARLRAPLLDAIESGRTPRPLKGKLRPDLVPSHKDFGPNQPEASAMTEMIIRWQADWGRAIVMDTHPGGVPATYGALGAADFVVSPTVLKVAELNACEDLCEELQAYELMIVPNMVERVPPDFEIKRLKKMSARFDVPVAPAISEHKWLGHRNHRRMAVSAANPVTKRSSGFCLELARVVKAMLKYV